MIGAFGPRVPVAWRSWPGVVIRLPAHRQGVNFDSLIFQTGFNDSGQSAFAAYLTGSGVDPSNDNGVWSGSPGSLALVARSGLPAPGTPSGVNFRDFFFPVTINNAGRVAFE